MHRPDSHLQSTLHAAWLRIDSDGGGSIIRIPQARDLMEINPRSVQRRRCVIDAVDERQSGPASGQLPYDSTSTHKVEGKMRQRGGLIGLVAAAVLLSSHGTLPAAPALDPDPASLARGEFVWHPEVSPAGPVVLVVSLDEQRAYVYRNGIAIGASTISSGRKGHETPTGVFTILQKDADHKSNKYNSAPMPYQQRLTWDGVALHAGAIPGHPASHGCVRLPKAFAKLLYGATRVGTTVTITGDRPVLDNETVETIDAMSDAEEPSVKTVSLPYKISQR